MFRLTDHPHALYLTIVLAPLAAAIITGFFGKKLSTQWVHRVAIIGVGASMLLSLFAYADIFYGDGETYNRTVYTWLDSGDLHFEFGFLIDRLSVAMMVVVSFVSWMIHIYTIGYMRGDPGYHRFFSYISLFTFAMLVLVMSNNFMQLFLGWEAVGLVSYLLIGFWYQRERAIFANLKAFLVNRVGDFGFLIGIAALFMHTQSLDYAEVFAETEMLSSISVNIVGDQSWSLVTLVCLCLFVGAMGKSAQMPLHVWLPDSMEGPTPISALIHAATMVTAGIFMVARMSPLYELSEVALNVILVVGATTAVMMGLLGLVQYDIKRVIAYSTLSQLGYMTVALGASAYAAALFHLITHAFFKALLFLGAGAVIIAMHHEQDLRRMGGLYKYLPITWITCFIGSLALIGFPGTSGFYSKDMIIEAVHHSTLPAAGYAYYAVLAGVFITALYSFRLFFMAFHGNERMDKATWSHLRECPAVMTVPLLVLAVPSLILGAFFVSPVLFGNYFGEAIYVADTHNVLAHMANDYQGAGYAIAWQFLSHALAHPAVVILMALGVLTAWLLYIKFIDWPATLAQWLHPLHQMLLNKYGFDDFNQTVFANGARAIGRCFWQIGDVRLINGVVVDGLAFAVRRLSYLVRRIQSGYLYHYAFVMIIGLLVLLSAFVIVDQ